MVTTHASSILPLHSELKMIEAIGRWLPGNAYEKYFFFLTFYPKAPDKKPAVAAIWHPQRSYERASFLRIFPSNSKSNRSIVENATSISIELQNEN